MSSPIIAALQPGSNHPSNREAQPSRSPWLKIVGGSVILAAIGGGIWYSGWGRHQESAQSEPTHASAGGGDGISVNVVHPNKGGMERVSNMAGSVHPYEVADLYANVSGYLKSQEILIDGKARMVDIGVHVKKGEILAIIDVPEVYAGLDQANANVEQAVAQAKQAFAGIATARAEYDATKAGVAEAEANVGRYTASRSETLKSFNRYTKLRGLNAVEEDVVDQRQDAYESAMAAEKSSRAAVITANAKVAAAKAKIDQALADHKAAEANVAVFQSKLKKAEVMVAYTKIMSPYTGVVTHRGYFAGDFIRSASDGNTRPMFTVARHDLMRIVTKISDLDVPYADVGDPAVITIDALPGVKLKGKISRFTEAEIPNERTMITEIDIPNDEKSPARGRLRDGMYGAATIELSPASNSLTLPSNCLIGPAEGNDNRVLLLRDGHAKATKVKTGASDGVKVEIVGGLKAEDEVVVPNGAVTDGTVVSPTAQAPAEAKKPEH